MNPRILNRKAKSYASSPQYLCDYFRSHHSSPVLKESPQIKRLVKDSLKKFRDEKVELEKIKEIALSWKKARKKKLEKYNIKTRLENKAKVKTTRDLDWKSSDLKDWNFSEKAKIMKKNRSVDRRANIGLEHFHIKSPKMASTTQAKQEKKVQIFKKSHKSEIVSFMKKKRKERIFKEKKEKSAQLVNEVKRLKRLMKVEKVAKKVLKKKPKTPKFKNLIPESFERIRSKVKSICYSEDEEVIKIINEKKNLKRLDDFKGRECMMLKNYPSYMSLKSSQLSSSQLNQKRVKIPKQLESNSSMPIIELRSISRSSSSDLSEKKESIKKKIQDIKFRLLFIKDDKNPRTSLLKAQNLLEKVVFQSLCEKFHIIKHFDLEKERKSLIESSLLAFSSRHSSEDLEKLWDRLEIFKPTEFLQDRDSLPSLTPIEDFRNSKQPSKRPSEEIPQFLIDQLKIINSCKGSFDINEVSQECLESSSKISENEEERLPRISFPFKNPPLFYPLYQFEPEPAEMKKSEMLIVDTSVSVVEFCPGFKENSLIESPEAEEVEEFSSEKIDKKYGFYEFSLEEIQVIDEILEVLIEDFFYFLVVLEIEKEFKAIQVKIVENSANFQGVCVRTGVSSVCKFVDLIWLNIDPIDLILALQSTVNSVSVLGNYQERPEISLSPLLSSKTLDLANADLEAGQIFSKIHNRMIFDCVNEFLSNIHRQLSPPLWQKGYIHNKTVDLDTVFRLVNQDIRRNSLVCAGRIANSSLLNLDGSVDEVLLQRIRESSLSAMLTGEIEDIEKAWVDYEADEFNVAFEISDLILNDLFAELAVVLFEPFITSSSQDWQMISEFSK